ncbi:unnamed protein product (macronuclear) [Paramecium tetraurelia]|uniref:Uncharacterized protein n=1 Tax=Paramecium tetraurelia TaxID=5888 RepID=A0DRW2_PARTE|nr:uncharacterized protein GSPATT00019483001 [Paramecium tetraurelia]CAK85779.1 unnamed protein product [Paramecium tetraurelia]|eukprot:XP_001453176.1 hypothetical protein (macronuclear) [Paramecium tetraurelia strain d4-2]
MKESLQQTSQIYLDQYQHVTRRTENLKFSLSSTKMSRLRIFMQRKQRIDKQYCQTLEHYQQAEQFKLTPLLVELLDMLDIMSKHCKRVTRNQQIKSKFSTQKDGQELLQLNIKQTDELHVDDQCATAEQPAHILQLKAFLIYSNKKNSTSQGSMGADCIKSPVVLQWCSLNLYYIDPQILRMHIIQLLLFLVCISLLVLFQFLRLKYLLQRDTRMNKQRQLNQWLQ